MFTQKNHPTTPNPYIPCEQCVNLCFSKIHPTTSNPRISCEGCDKKCEITACPIYNTRNEIIGYMPKIGNNIIFSYIDGNNTPRTVNMTPITHGPAKSTVEQLAFTISQYCDYHKQSLQKTK
ncbi:MAG: hypothetical protein J6S06_00880 [Alphaproteobacteria bacterium]|nr:hypothetical protein [Alphaproteobacteria bacterium]